MMTILDEIEHLVQSQIGGSRVIAMPDIATVKNSTGQLITWKNGRLKKLSE